MTAGAQSFQAEPIRRQAPPAAHPSGTGRSGPLVHRCTARVARRQPRRGHLRDQQRYRGCRYAQSLEYGFARDVVLATPSTLLALLRTVAYSWRQERLARDADQVLEVGRRLHARLTTLSGHLTRLGSALGTTMARYNETIGSYERSVLTAARRFDDLGVGEQPVPEPEPLEATVRALCPEVPVVQEACLDLEDDALDDARDGTRG